MSNKRQIPRKGHNVPPYFEIKMFLRVFVPPLPVLVNVGVFVCFQAAPLCSHITGGMQLGKQVVMFAVVDSHPDRWRWCHSFKGTVPPFWIHVFHFSFAPLSGSTLRWHVVVERPGSPLSTWLWSWVFDSGTDWLCAAPACRDHGGLPSEPSRSSPSSGSSRSRWRRDVTAPYWRVAVDCFCLCHAHSHVNGHTCVGALEPEQDIWLCVSSLLTARDSLRAKSVPRVRGWRAAVWLPPQGDITVWHQHSVDQRQCRRHQTGVTCWCERSVNLWSGVTWTHRIYSGLLTNNSDSKQQQQQQHFVPDIC